MKPSLIVTISLILSTVTCNAQNSFSSPEPKSNFTSFSPLFPNKQSNTNVNNTRDTTLPSALPPALPSTNQALRNTETPWTIRAPEDCDVQNIDMQFINSNPGLPLVVVSVFCKDTKELYLNYRITKKMGDEKLPKAIQVLKDPSIKGKVEW